MIEGRVSRSSWVVAVNKKRGEYGERPLVVFLEGERYISRSRRIKQVFKGVVMQSLLHGSETWLLSVQERMTRKVA